MAEVARAGLASECLGLDATIFGARLKQESVSADLKYLAGVVRAGDNLVNGLSNAARIALAGRKRFEDVEFAMHVTISADAATIAEDRCARCAASASASAARSPPASRAPPVAMRMRPATAR